MASRATHDCAECGTEMSWMELCCPNEECAMHFYCRECGGPFIRTISSLTPMSIKCDACKGSLRVDRSETPIAEEKKR